VPGPRLRGHIGGAPVSELYGVGVLSPGSAVNITVWSYVDQVGISVLSDDRTFRDVHEVTHALVHSFREIRCAAGLSDQLSTVQSTMPPTRPAAG
jgi:diacylglycerol O-acyltransferase / wax synthase